MKITIKYYADNYEYKEKALDLSNKLLDQYKNSISSLEIIPSSESVFEVTKDETVIHSKKDEGKFPNPDEILEMFL